MWLYYCHAVYIYTHKKFNCIFKKKIYNEYCKDTICSPSPKWLGCKPNEPNTINLQKVDEKAGLLANEITASKDLKYEQAQKQM